MKMSEPLSSAAAGAGAAAGWKLIGGAAGAMGAGAALVSIVVMLMTPPRSPKEWAVGLISTVMGSICGGAFVIEHFNMQALMGSFNGLLAVLGIAFACGLPAWAIVRWTFTFIQNRRDGDLAQIAEEIRRQIGGGNAN